MTYIKSINPRKSMFGQRKRETCGIKYNSLVTFNVDKVIMSILSLLITDTSVKIMG